MIQMSLIIVYVATVLHLKNSTGDIIYTVVQKKGHYIIVITL